MTELRQTPIGLLVRGATLSYLGVMVLLPLVALSIQAAEPGAPAFWKALSDPFAWHALKLTFATATAMAIADANTRTGANDRIGYSSSA